PRISGEVEITHLIIQHGARLSIAPEAVLMVEMTVSGAEFTTGQIENEGLFLLAGLENPVRSKVPGLRPGLVADWR
ncbi:MAG: hypothetical protein AAFV07_12765, partial [Bacteroidota bacterium]